MRPVWLAAAAWVCTAVQASGPEPQVTQITWLVNDTLAVRSASGIERPSDQLIGWLTKRLPGIEHRRMPANAKRSWRLMEAGERVCHSAAVRLPERERLAYFSNTWLLPPVHLIVAAPTRARLPLDAASQVDLTRLLADKQLHGMVVQGRSYGREVDAQLAEAASGDALQFITAGDFGSNVLPMLLRGRIDYALEYPNALLAFAATTPEVARLVALPIQGATTPIVSGVACPRTPWGHAAIRRIDQALGNAEGAAMLKESLLVQISPETQRTYAEALTSFFHRRSQPTPGL